MFLMLLLIACKKVVTPLYEGGQGLYFNDTEGGEDWQVDKQGDSISYSFANQVKIKMMDTVFLKMKALGKLSDKDRVVQLEAVGSTNATEGVHYKLPKIVLPAGQYRLQYPVILYNVPDLKEKTLRLELKVAPNNDFVEGSGISSVRKSFTRFKINFNNRLIKPVYWDNGIFGEYSDVKYRFMMETLSISDFSFETNGYSEIINYSGAMYRALETYTALHGPMLDELGRVIYFPE